VLELPIVSNRPLLPSLVSPCHLTASPEATRTGWAVLPAAAHVLVTRAATVGAFFSHREIIIRLLSLLLLWFNFLQCLLVLRRRHVIFAVLITRNYLNIHQLAFVLYRFVHNVS
jgi:hypothetical protein